MQHHQSRAAGAAFFAKIADALPEIAWTARPDGSVDFFNRRWFHYVGADPADAGAMTWARALREGDRAAFERRWHAALASTGAFEAEVAFRRADGIYRWHLCRAAPLRGEDGRVEGWLGVCTDIDDHKRAEESLGFLYEAGRKLASSSTLASSLKVDETLRNVAELATATFADWCAITLRLPDGTLSREVIVHKDAGKAAAVRELLEYYPLVPGDPISEAIGSGDALLVPHVDWTEPNPTITDDRLRTLLQFLNARSTMIVPLRARGSTFGALSLVSSETGKIYDGADLELAQAFARRAALQIDNARLFEEVQRRTKHLEFLARVGEELIASIDLQQTLDTIVGLVVPEYADWTTISLIGPGGEIRTAAIRHADPAKLDMVRNLLSTYRLDPNSPYGSAAAIRSGKTQLAKNVDDEMIREVTKRSDRPDRAQATLVELGFHSFIAVPLRTQQRTVGALLAMWAKPDRSYDEGDVPLFEELARRSAMALANAESYRREQRVAHTLQEAFLPPTLPRVAGLRFDALYEPGTSEAEIGGDWYDAFALADGRIVLTIGDVSGHGLDAAVLMAKVRQMFRALGVGGLGPAEILRGVNAALLLEGRSSMITAIVGLIDPDQGTFTYASAGHPPPLLRTPDGPVAELTGSGLPLGVDIDGRALSVPTHTVGLSKDSLLVLYTDGLTEATHDLSHGERLLREAVADPAVAADANPAHAIRRAVIGGAARDDIAILTVAIAR